MLMTIAPKRASMSDAAAATFPATSFGVGAALLSDYLTDALQRSVLFLNLLHRRGKEELVIASRPTTTALRFHLAA
jgi:hypothetical protein